MVPDDCLRQIEDRMYRIETKLDKFIEGELSITRDLAAEISDVEEEVRATQLSVTTLLEPWVPRVLARLDDDVRERGYSITCILCDVIVNPVPGAICNTKCLVCCSSEWLVFADPGHENPDEEGMEHGQRPGQGLQTGQECKGGSNNGPVRRSRALRSGCRSSA